MAARILLALLAAVLSGVQPAAGAPQAHAGRTVVGVQVLVDGEPASEPTLGYLIETAVGAPLSLSAVRESIAQLYSLGQFQDIQVEALEAPGGVLLRYNLIPVRTVQRVEFEGQLGVSERTLRSAMNERFGPTPQLTRLSEVVRVLERLYQDRGFFSASVRPASTELRDPPRTVLTFEINAGPQARIGSIDTPGGGPAPAELLRDLGVAAGRPYQRPAVDRRIEEYVQRLRARGYLQASGTHRARLSPDRHRADITLDVRPGPLVTVRFEGDPLPADRRAELAPLQREGSADEDLLEDSVGRIRAYLREQGHWRADVAVEQQRFEEGRLAIVFTVRTGPVYRVAPGGVEISGNASVPAEELRALVPLAPGDLYVASRLDAAVGSILRLYRTRGFAWAAVTAAENEIDEPAGANALVRPVIAIAEGPRALLGDVAVTGARAVDDAQIRRILRLEPGDPFYEPSIDAARDTVQLEYLNLGFASADVRLITAVSEDRTRVNLTVAIDEGPQTIVDRVIIVGNQRTAESVIRREVLLRPGEPLGLRDLLESRRRLGALGLFRRIDIRELEHGPPTSRDVLVTVEEAPATTISYGGGLEVTRRLRAVGEGGTARERIEPAPRGFFDIGRRNLGGKNRSVNLFTRVSVRPSDAPDDPSLDGRGLAFNEYRVVGTYRQPAALLWGADLSLTGAVEQGIRSSFNFTRKGTTAEVARRLSPTVRTSFRYSFGTTRTYDERLNEDEQAAIDRLFPQVRLSTFSTAVVRDTRDDVVEPTGGTFLSAEGSLSARALGGQVGFMKTYVQGYWFRQLSRSRNVVFASRASLGLADGFERPAQSGDPLGTIEDLPASERFFAGGDTTIRGFALDTVGAAGTISERGFPTGGNAVLILNGELRVPVWRDVGAALFVDGGNVFRRVTDFAIDELRGSAGFGLRYRSPIGPIRLDLAFKMDRREIGGALEPRRVLHFSIGQAF